MLGSLLSSSVSWVFSKNSAFLVGIIACIGFWFVWRNAVELLEVRSIIFEERLDREQMLSASWKNEALRLQGIVKASSKAVKNCLERERSTSQAQATVRELAQELRQKIRKTNTVPTDTLGAKAFRGPCSGHERILEYLGRPLALP